MDIYNSRRLSGTTTQIMDCTGVYAFLVEGEEKAVLIDTCTGVGDLKGYVEKLTDKPLSVILTHGHCDHAGGAAPFGTVYLNDADLKLVQYHAGMDMKMDYARFCNPEVCGAMSEKDFCPVRTGGYSSLRDGQRFDLGGVTLEAIQVPGHTKGMTCILNIEERTILFGDACNNGLFIWAEEATSIEEYLESLIRLKKHETRYDTVYMSHGEVTVDKRVLDGSIEVCREVMDGKADGQPFDFMEHHLLMAKKTNEKGERADGGIGNLVYDPKKVFRERA